MNPKIMTPVIDKRIGARLRLFRVTAGLTQVTVSKRLRVSQGTLSKLENGTASERGKSTVAIPASKWAEVLKTTPELLFG